jgi:hypothetical protein
MADKNRRFSIKVKKNEWKKRFSREREREREGAPSKHGRAGASSFPVAREAIAPSFLFLVSQLLSFFLSLPVLPATKKTQKQ